MTKRDYVKFAGMLKDCQPELDIFAGKAERAKSFAAYGLWCRIVQNTADIFAADRPTFDRGRFLHAAGLAEV